VFGGRGATRGQAQQTCVEKSYSTFKLESGVGKSYDDKACSFHLQVRGHWILRHEQRAIWLPPELRGRTHATSVLGVMALGCATGSISFWEIVG
jgi:hypothetical protein